MSTLIVVSVLTHIFRGGPGILRADTSLTDLDDRDTVKLVQKECFIWDNVPYLYRTSTADTIASEDMLTEAHFDDDDNPADSKEYQHQKDEGKKPKLSWFVTVFLLLIVTVVSIVSDACETCG